MLERSAPRPSLLDGLPEKHFGAILCDPPWRFKTWNKATSVKRRGSGTNVSAAVHYRTMTLADIASLPVESVATADCALFLWTCWPLLKDALRIVEWWGFEYKTCAFDWAKARVDQIDMFRDDADAHCGMGYWTRSNTEPCLLATRGRPRRLHRDVRMGIIEPRREHSRKPDCVHKRIERLVGGPYLELFGRQERANWTIVGDEVGKFKAAVLNQEGIKMYKVASDRRQTGIAVAEVTVVEPPKPTPLAGLAAATASVVNTQHVEGEPSKSDFSVLQVGERLQITADVDEAGLAKLQAMLAKYAEILKMMKG